jgi:hypothetical protein
MIRKRREERGSPCLRPLLGWMQGHEMPFNRMVVLADSVRRWIQLSHLRLKPLVSTTLGKQSQETVLNAFLKSNFRMTVFFFLILLVWTNSRA